MKTPLIFISILALGCNSPASEGHTSPKASRPSFQFEPIQIKTRPATGPEYPAKARAGHIEGTVPVYIHVSATGQILSIYSNQGPEMLRKAAEDYAKQFTFIPAKLNGVVTTARYTLNVVFSLNN